MKVYINKGGEHAEQYSNHLLLDRPPRSILMYMYSGDTRISIEARVPSDEPLTLIKIGEDENIFVSS